MATTTPDNLRTPSLENPYQLVADMATLASDVQDALTKRGNSYKGTRAQRLAFTTAPADILWRDTDSIQMIWTRTGNNWVPAVKSWSGTTAERSLLGTIVPTGFLWYDTTEKSLTIYDGTAWRYNTWYLAANAFSGSTYSGRTGTVTDNGTKTVSLLVNATRTTWTTGGATAIAAVAFDARPTSSRGVVVSWSGAAAPFTSFGLLAADGTVTAYNSPTNGQSWTASVSAIYAL